MNTNDGTRLRISPGNSKIGDVPNLSLTPGASCGDVPCIDKCYAMHTYKRWTSVRRAWDYNLQYYKHRPVEFYQELAHFFATTNSRRFRYFVGGDFPDKRFFSMVVRLAKMYPLTSVLAFTKRYEFVPRNGKLPSNFNLILSIWPGLDIPEFARNYPTAWLSCDDRFDSYFGKKSSYIKCRSSCGECGYQCWGAASPTLPVIFDLHK